jgi:hypothetical protein
MSTLSSIVHRLSSFFHRIDPNIWLVIAFSLFAVLPLAGPNYFFDAHDAPHTAFFLTEFDAAIRDGVWYPGWATDQALGYGYPTFVLYPPLAYYTAEVFHLLGASKVAAIKWVWALATVGSGLAMYAYARYVMGRGRGLLAAVVYVYMPYHLVDIYVRADLVEYSAFVWMPLALLAFHRLVEDASLRHVGLAALTYGALWMTHNQIGLIFTPLLAVYVLFRLLVEKFTWRDRFVRAAAALGGSLLGLGIAAVLLLPNLFERRFINQEQWVRAGYDYTQNFVQPFHLLSSAWGYLPGSPGAEGGMSFQLGAVPLILALVAAVGIFWQPTKERSLILFYAIATIPIVFLMLPISAPLWRLLPIAALVQFPWRFLALTAVTLAVLSGFAIPKPQSTSLPISSSPTMILALVAVLGSFAYTLPQYTPIPEIAEGPLMTIEFELRYTDMRGMTKWTQEFPTDSPLIEQYLAGEDLVTAQALAPDASVEMIRAGGASDELWVRSPSGTALQFYTYYFPGWRVTVDGERLPDDALRPEGPYGLLTVDIPAGEHHVLLRWGDTPLRFTGKALTLVCLALAIVLVLVIPRWSQRRVGAAGTSRDDT